MIFILYCGWNAPSSQLEMVSACAHDHSACTGCRVSEWIIQVWDANLCRVTFVHMRISCVIVLSYILCRESTQFWVSLAFCCVAAVPIRGFRTRSMGWVTFESGVTLSMHVPFVGMCTFFWDIVKFSAWFFPGIPPPAFCFLLIHMGDSFSPSDFLTSHINLLWLVMYDELIWIFHFVWSLGNDLLCSFMHVGVGVLHLLYWYLVKISLDNVGRISWL